MRGVRGLRCGCGVCGGQGGRGVVEVWVLWGYWCAGVKGGGVLLYGCGLREGGCGQGGVGVEGLRCG